MEPFEHDDQLAEDLRALKPTPRPEFTAELDERAAAGFPRRSRPRRPTFSLPSWSPRRMLLPAGGVAVIAIAISMALIATNEREPEAGDSFVQQMSRPAQPSAGGNTSAGSAGVPELDATAATKAESDPFAERPTSSSQTESHLRAGGPRTVTPLSQTKEYGTNLSFDGSGTFAKGNVRPRKRAVERSARIVLAAEPGDVAEDSRQVFEAVHAHDGIVMRSSTREGKAGAAGARFELLIPSARLGDALAALSEIDEVRSRHEATADITAPTVNVGELLQDSKARIDSLLGQLAEAGAESEREAVEAELRQERRHRARLRSQLQDLQRRADLSRVSLRIETGAADESSGGTWGVDDALRDAGQILGVAAAVTLVALAVIAPIVLIGLLAWLANRAWVRRERRRVLS